MNAVTPEKMDAFIAALQAKQDARMERLYPKLDKPKFEANWLKRYVRIEKVESFGGRSAFCFIDPANGDILKSAGWRTPAKHSRGNIMGDDHGIDHLGPYGAASLR